MSTDEIIVGIDLGTTFSLVACADERGPRVLRDETGEGRLPSVIGVIPDPDGGKPQIRVGWDARNHAVENARTTVYSIKRLIGKSLSDIQQELPFLAYAVTPGPRETVQVEIDGVRYTPEEVSSVILRVLRERAEQSLGRPVRKAVITVPAYFDDAQRQATRDAGQTAGLEVVRIINEPTAAALAYGIGLRETEKREAKTTDKAADDFGFALPKAAKPGGVSLPIPSCGDADGASSPPAGGDTSTSTVAVYDLGGGTFDVSILRIENGVYQVLSTAGDTRLGGDDFDRVLIRMIQHEVQHQFEIEIDNPTTRQALRGLTEQVKINLSQSRQTEFELELGQGRLYRRTITAEEFETKTLFLVERTIDLFRHALSDAGLTTADIGRVILVGGSTRMPHVRRRVEEVFGKPPYTALDPDEVVALGAAVQASILAGREMDMLLLDVTPLSLGIETMGGAVSKLIVRNTTVPCRATEMFTTFVDGQTAIKLNVVQGERELAKDCRSLGEFQLRDLPPMPAGMPKVEVEFLIDANGILKVSAVEQRSGNAASIQIVPNRGLTREEVERMDRDGVEFASADLHEHRRIDLLNQIEFDTQKTWQMLDKYGKLLDKKLRARIEEEIVAVRELAKSTEDLDELQQALDAFGKGTLPLAEVGIREALKKGRRSDDETPPANGDFGVTG